MNKIAYLVDSTSLLSKEEREKWGIFEIPLQIIMDENSYLENQEITTKVFYEKIRGCKIVKTSQPALGKAIEVIEELKEKGFTHFVMFTLSKKLSGTYQTFHMAATETNISYELYDTEISTTFLDDIVCKYIELNNKEEFLRWFEQTKKQVEYYIVPADLDQLHKSGRISGSLFFIGSLIRLQPILKFENGVIDAVGKVRNQKGLKKYIYEKLDNGIKNNKLVLLHGGDYEKATEWKLLLEEDYPGIEITIDYLPCTPGVHAGKGTICFCWYNLN